MATITIIRSIEEQGISSARLISIFQRQSINYNIERDALIGTYSTVSILDYEFRTIKVDTLETTDSYIIDVSNILMQIMYNAPNKIDDDITRSIVIKINLYDNTNREILSTENGTNWEAYRVVMFCNEDCPIYCSSIVTANNNCAGSAVIVDSSQLAVYTVDWENPDTLANTWKVEVADDSDTFVPVIRAWLDQDLGGSHTEMLSRSVEWDRWNFKTEFLWTWNQTDSVKLFKISRNVAGVQTLGLNVDINVQFQTGATNDELTTLLENAIYSAMFNSYSAVDGIDYDVIVTITGSGSSRTAGVAFVSKNVVASTWFGPNATSDYLHTITT